MKIQVKGSRSVEPLCPTCQYGMVMRGARESEERIYCNYINKDMKTNVHECSEYRDKKSVSLREMQGMATIIVPKKNGTFGFMTVKQWEKENPNEDLIDVDTSRFRAPL